MEDLVHYILWWTRLEKKRKSKEFYPDGSHKPLPPDSMDLYDLVEKTKISRAAPDVYDMVTADSDTVKEASRPSSAFNYQVKDIDSKKSSKKWRRTRLILLISAIALIIAVCISLIVALVQISDLRSDVMLLKSTSPANIVNGFTSLNNVMLDTAIVSDLTNQLRDFMEQIINNVTESNSQFKKNSASLRATLDGILEVTITRSFASCAEAQQLFPSFPSGYYRVSPDGSDTIVYCDMTRSCGDITGGWMRVALLDMRNTITQCPSGFTESNNLNIRNCIQTGTRGECSAINYQTNGIMYSKVCGMIRAYQVKYPEGFANRSIVRPRFPTPGQNYVDGVSLTHGMLSKQHIWSLAASSKCDCSIGRPSFVGNNFSCDGVRVCPDFCGEALWDGDGCQSNNSPWFYRQLPQSTTDNIDVKICRDEARSDEDIAIEMIEILVQ